MYLKYYLHLWPNPSDYNNKSKMHHVLIGFLKRNWNGCFSCPYIEQVHLVRENKWSYKITNSLHFGTIL